ncbi:DUF2326 domain-containing protein [Brevibacillus laterosporus]|uniref:DUF2326 domain-containing protein n=1 Tax=Brevibacillus laterosporus TaxID=1465 RepID=UPI000C76812B|nr:DUF2326 domain-containing protein [Brevibacillus laterosporus]AUM63540.1 DUF2326 domain-containing protein [Brevibacillus laterosporus]
MDRVVNRIKLIKLYSEPEVFEPILFEDGVNIILGEKSDANTTRGRKTNGVGKSMSIEFINFCLLKKYSDSRIRLIPDEALSDNVLIKLQLQIGKEEITLIRSKGEQNRPQLRKNGETIIFENVDEAQRYLKDLLYNDFNEGVLPSFRELIAPLIRDEKSEFKSILECFDVSKKIPVSVVPHLYFLNISLEIYNNVQETIKKIERYKSISTNTKKEVTSGNQKKISDVRAELNALNDEVLRMNEAIESFRSSEAFDSIEKDLVEMEDLLDKLRVRQKAIKYELQKIKNLPKPEEIDSSEIELIYNQFKQGLGDLIVKSLEKTLEFKTKIETFQRSLINQRATDLQNELYEVTEKIRGLDEQYGEKLKIIDQKGVLKNLKSSLKIYNQKNQEYSKRIGLYKEYEHAEKEKKNLFLKKTQEVYELDNEIDEKKNVLNSFLNTVLSIHELIMGNKECSFAIETINNKTNKQTVKIEMRIYDDGSHSVDRTKVFIYDMSLLFNKYTRIRHPGLLIHDNIFDVDQDTLVQSLNFLAKQEENYQDFQYILTLNRDKIEHEEKMNQIKLDIEKHKVATYTKDNKFLKTSYQEI